MKENTILGNEIPKTCQRLDETRSYEKGIENISHESKDNTFTVTCDEDRTCDLERS